MGVSLYDQIEEESEALGKEVNLNDGEEDGKDNERSVRQDKPVRRQPRSKQAEHTGQGAVPELRGETSERGTESGEGAPRSEGGTSPEDGGSPRGSRRASRKGSEGASQDAQASHEDGEEVLETADKEAVEKEPTNADFARMRREARELKAKLAKYESASAPALPSAPATPSEVKPSEVKPVVDAKSAEPDREVDYRAWLEWKIAQQDSTIQEQAKLTKDYQDWRAETQTISKNQQLINDAVQELGGIEESYKKQNSDYMNAVEFGRNKYADALKITNPNWTQKQIDTKIDMDVLKFASDCSTKGLNPAEELYDMMIERFGYTKSQARQAVEDDVELPRGREARPNLRSIATNRRRSASPLSGGGQGGSVPITREIAGDMSIGEFSKLSPSDLADLENSY